MGVTRRDIEKIAALAELGVDDAAAAELERQLTRILDYVAQLGEVGDDAISPVDERATRLRRDVLDPDPLTRTPQEIAPAFQDGLFTVPRRTPAQEGTTPPMRRPQDPTPTSSPPRRTPAEEGTTPPMRGPQDPTPASSPPRRTRLGELDRGQDGP